MLPVSMDAVVASDTDVPLDVAAALFPRGAGLDVSRDDH